MPLLQSYCVRQSRETGSALVLAIILVVMMSALVGSNVMTVQSNLKQAEFMGVYEDLRQYALSGSQRALHDLRNNISGNDGKVGTVSWTVADDVGMDGIASTQDEGEGDGIPSPRETNLSPASIGPSARNYELIVYSETIAWSDITRVISTAYRDNIVACVETYVQSSGGGSVPMVGAVYMDPGVPITVNGGAFRVNGNDTNVDGSSGAGPDGYGVTTEDGSPAGSNASKHCLANPRQSTESVPRRRIHSFHWRNDRRV